ncbi:hypothetical protein AZOA_04540 [Azoarcus sp. Aa7]|nr:hypothetical protein [Azoarcus sp. Aa7]
MKSFSQQLSSAVVRINQQTEQAVRKVIFECFRSVILKSPVKTGRFRANWKPGIGSIPEGVINELDPSGGKTIQKVLIETEDAMALVMDGRPLYIVNHVPYGLALEFGSSKQAPSGMVRTTLAEIAAKYGA